MSEYPINLYLVRHGETEGNVTESIYQHKADHAIELTPRGERQARCAGVFLLDHLNSEQAATRTNKGNTRMWVSPYNRARETARFMMQGIGDSVGSVREDIRLAEQQYGLFDGLSTQEISEQFPNEYRHYQKCKDFGGRFWARTPSGESRFDVALRVHDFFSTLQRDLEKHRFLNHIIVAHGVVNRAIVMRWLHLMPEWFEAEANPPNASIRHITGTLDQGYIYSGEQTADD